MKTLTTGRSSNKGQRIKVRAWNKAHDLKTVNIKHNAIIFKNDREKHGIMLSLNNWESLIVFLAESFAQAELDASGETGEIEITLTVNRKS